MRPPWWRDPALLPSVISGVFLVAGLALEWSGAGTPALMAQWIALLAGAWTFVPGAIRRLARGRLGVGLLMTIAAVGAVLLGHVGEAAALAFLFSLAETLEDRAMDRAREGLRALLSLIPETARVSRLSGDVTVPVTEVRELDLLRVGAGERVATDGVVVEGRSGIDTSAVTGEAIPVEVGPGDAVPAGVVNGAGSLLIEATADGRDNSLTQIVALVEQAHARKGERARLADRIARPLVPAVLVAAALVALFGVIAGDPWTWIERSLVVLVAASPCALAIAVPVTVISAIGSASRFGVVITSGAAFERFGTIRTVAFDKTGTLTRGEPTVVDVRTTGDATRDEVLALAAAVESTSTHPLASAITAAAPGVTAAPAPGAEPATAAPGGTPTTAVPGPTPATDVAENAGHGITGRVGARTVRVGSPRWVDPGPLRDDAGRMAAAGMTAVVVEVDGRAAGLIGVRDELRPEAAETVGMLRDQGVDVVMLTGDTAATAHALAAEAGIAEVRAEQRPSDKAHAITELAAVRPTAMVGDGINDAPALATATVGIAMGATGSAAAVESADIAFTGHDLRLIPAALAHSRRGHRIMTVNIALALAIIVVLFPLALSGVLGLAGVVLVHEVAEVVVILNGIRAARRRGGPAVGGRGDARELTRSGGGAPAARS
ncbi:heavy metal translocating P-type ATPase [Myceligenerans pegani]|uniref:Cation-translocating P-type ATPase n=1 Tax=Myceligenerans pegani TaxID=2776917 RepID=A0ABR9N1Q8_9MICO|nr:cation-translocating P-type ATPase [Myceligenerans sp. TRM 65318]MBE1877595.1 cation-translocating P-type ATPase [Myceligenerans sp. TRM 65318]MBE3019866.1 cation-translocating P-type ATPase [Myceligenerans sp. TRM 65318]